MLYIKNLVIVYVLYYNRNNINHRFIFTELHTNVIFDICELVINIRLIIT